MHTQLYATLFLVYIIICNKIFLFSCSAVVVNPKLQFAVVEVHALSRDAATSPGEGKKRLGNVLKE